jgi:DNA-3-methyladenine glycosylase
MIDQLLARRRSLAWYRRDPAALARALLGCALVHRGRAAMIVETEAYLGPDDLASHARFGATERTSVMFGPGGVSYVYLCYGMHQMFNIVSGRAGEPGAVLVRAAHALAGFDDGVRADALRGPGKLTRALAIGRAQDRLALDGDALYVARWKQIAARAIARGPRIGVDYAGAWAARPLRFWIKDHPAVSRPPRSA